jgi:hypothetical protein
VKPRAVAAAPAAPAIPAAPAFIPAPGTRAGGDDPRDARVGSDIADARARAEFSGRPLWSAMVECIGRMELIQARGGGSAKVQIDGYAVAASSVTKLDRGVDQAAAMARQLDAERAAASSSSSSSSSGGAYSGPSSSGDNGAAARREHEATMQRYERENRQIRQDIKAIDRKYR